MQIARVALWHSLWCAFALAWGLCAACGAGSGLSGSVGKRVDLNYTGVALTLTAGATGSLDILYSSDKGSVADVLVDSVATDLSDLVDAKGQDFMTRVHLGRSSGLRGGFPPVQGGTFHLYRHNFDVTRASAAGTFHFVFTDGAMLDGQFDGQAAVQLHF